MPLPLLAAGSLLGGGGAPGGGMGLAMSNASSAKSDTKTTSDLKSSFDAGGLGNRGFTFGNIGGIGNLGGELTWLPWVIASALALGLVFWWFKRKG